MRGPCSTCRPAWRIGAISEQPPHDSGCEAARPQTPSPGEPTPRGGLRFPRWRAAVPGHGAGREGLAGIEDYARDLAGEPEILLLRGETLGRIREHGPRSLPAWRGAAALAASVLLVVSTGVWLATGNMPQLATLAEAPVAGERIHTTVGQRAEVSLADGSTVMLNTDSELKVAFDEGRRRVELVRGQAWFEVAKDPSRPFVVMAAGQEITALGTAFDVRIDRDRLEVMLVEGRVRVARPAPEGQAPQSAGGVVLLPQQMLVMREDDLAVRKLSDTSPVESWRNGFLVFDDQPLSEAVDEFNRYAARPIRVADSETGAIRISGAFKIGDDRAFLGALSAGFGVDAEISDTAITLTRD